MIFERIMIDALLRQIQLDQPQASFLLVIFSGLGLQQKQGASEDKAHWIPE